MILDYNSIETFINPYVIILIGFCVGILGVYLGNRSLFLTVPALQIFGIPAVFAVGSDIALVCSKTIFTIRNHKTFYWSLILMLSITSMVGLYLAQRLILFLEQLHLAGLLVSCLYIILLTFSIIYFVRHKNFGSNKLHLSPVIKVAFAARASLFIAVFIGMFSGLLFGLIGGGALLVQILLLVYFLALPLSTAVTTCSLALLGTSFFGICLWASTEKMLLPLTVLLLLGLIFGVQIGSSASKLIPADKFTTKTRNTLLIMSGAKTMLALILFMTGFNDFAKLLIIAAILSPAIVIVIIMLLEKFVITDM